MLDERDGSSPTDADDELPRSAEEALVRGAEVLAGLGKYSEARVQLDAALRANPKNAKARTLAAAISEAQVAPFLGEAAGHFLSNRLKEAEELLRRALDIEPEHPQAVRMLDSIRERRGNAATGRRQPVPRLYEPAAGAEPDSPPSAGSRSVTRPTVPAAVESPDTKGSAIGFGRRRAFALSALAFALLLVVVWLRSTPPRSAIPEQGLDRAADAAAPTLDRSQVGAPKGASGSGSDRAPDGAPDGAPVAAPVDSMNAERTRPSDRGAIEVGLTGAEVSAPAADSEPDAESVPEPQPFTEGAGSVAAKEVRPRAAPPDPEIDPEIDPAVDPAGESSADNYFTAVTAIVAEAKGKLDGGDWEGALDSASNAADLAPQASAVVALQREILTRARTAAVSARQEAETSGAAAGATRFFGDAVELVEVGNDGANESALVAARSYYVASDLFRRSSEQAQLRGMRLALDAYAAAHREVDFDRLTALWPDLTGERYEAVADSFEQAKTVEMKIDRCATSLHSAGGVATCRVTQSYVPRRGLKQTSSSQMRFELRRDGSAWRIHTVNPTGP